MSSISLRPEPHDKQKLVLDYCNYPGKEAAMYVVVVAGRQAGKSTMAKQQAIYWALQNPGCRIWYVMPRESQARNVQRDIMNVIQGTEHVKSSKTSAGQIEIIFSNGSILEFKSGSSDALRGTPVNYLILDEAAYLNQRVVESDIIPALNVAGKKVLICSTPKGKNWFYGFYLKGLDKNNRGYRSFKFLSTDNPLANKEQIELARQSAPEAIFRQEYLAEFVEGAEVFPGIDEVCNIRMPKPFEMDGCLPEKGKSYYCGIDIGLRGDDTVVTIFDNMGTMVFMDRFTNIRAEDCVERILRQLRRWRPRKAVIEENNQGLVIYEYIKKQYANIEPFTTTNKSKEEIINRMIAGFSNRKIHAFDDDEIKLQLQSFVFSMTSTGKIRYHAAAGFHDDIVMSMALAYDLVTERGLRGGYSIMTSAGYSPKPGASKSTKRFTPGTYLPSDYRGEYRGDDPDNPDELLFFT